MLNNIHVVRYFPYRTGQPIRDGKMWFVFPRHLLSAFEEELHNQTRQFPNELVTSRNHVAYLVKDTLGHTFGVRFDDFDAIICDGIVEGTE